MNSIELSLTIIDKIKLQKAASVVNIRLKCISTKQPVSYIEVMEMGDDYLEILYHAINVSLCSFSYSIDKSFK